MRKSDAANNVDYTRLLAEIPIPQHSRHGSYEAPPNAIGDPRDLDRLAADRKFKGPFHTLGRA